MRTIGVCLALVSGIAHADDRTPVNLLTSVPSTVAVSSTVDNAKLRPEHLVDGDPKTAWNSRTGELVGAWIAFRVPSDAQIGAIKLTSGFTHVDKKLGDLFAQNPRIKRVRIARNGATIGDYTLDTESRALQEIEIVAPGGDFRITVLETVPGTKKTWREACVSELQVWGTTATSAAPRAHKPAVRIASLDAPPTLTKAACVKAVLPSTKGVRIVATDQLGLSPDVTICRIDHHPAGEKGHDLTVEVAAVKRTTRKVIAQETYALEVGAQPDEGTGDLDVIHLTLVPLTVKETALLVEVTDRREGPMTDVGTTKATLYRIARAAWSSILTFDSSWSEGEGGTADRCELQDVAPGPALPKQLVVDCVASTSNWHDPDPDERGIKETPRVERHRWTGSAYEKK